jgi:uncharacterized membrane protein YsdA (DUF1294 family)
MKIMFSFVVGINLLGFLMMGFDKLKSKLGLWRIKERTLLVTALAFGSAGIYLGLLVFRHKTNHRQFTMILPVMLVIHISLVLWLSRFL